MEKSVVVAFVKSGSSLHNHVACDALPVSYDFKGVGAFLRFSRVFIIIGDRIDTLGRKLPKCLSHVLQFIIMTHEVISHSPELPSKYVLTSHELCVRLEVLV